MTGELSPDRLFYWDGERWVNALSPDGAWRWDGAAWQPSGRLGGSSNAPRSPSRLPWLVAAGVIATVIVVSASTYFAWGFVKAATLRALQGTTVASCSSKLAQPGAALTSGEGLCGARLGSEHVLADCTVSAGTPDGIDVWQKNYAPTEGDWMQSTVTSGPAGCNLAASPQTDVSFDTSNEEPAQTVVIADFTVTANTGAIGIQLACSEAASCIDISVYSDGYYSLDQGKPHDGWDRLSKGYVSFGAPMRMDRANRMILSLSGSSVAVWINGVLLTTGRTTREQSSGFVDFYLDNRDGKATESVWLQRMYVFDSLPP